MDCPNDRYVNDESICQAVAAMLARVGVKVDLNAQPKAKYFAKVLASGGFDTSFYLLGWTPGSLDSWNVLSNLMNCRNEAGEGSPFNLGGFCDDKIDELTGQVLTEIDPEKRDGLIAGAIDRGGSVSGGFDRFARTFAHEIGHYMTLPHNHGSSCPSGNARNNLMAQTRCISISARDAVTLTSGQGSDMRGHCTTQSGC